MRGFVAIAALIAAAPALAQDPLAPLPPAGEPTQTPTPAPAPITAAPILAPAPVVIPRDWKGVFSAIRAQDWPAASAGIAALPTGPLNQVARAELYTARNSPRAELSQIAALLAEAPDLPQANQLGLMAQSRGATEPMLIAQPYPVVGLGAAPRRLRARPVSGEPEADTLRAALDPLLKLDQAEAAEALMVQSMPLLSYEARAEAAQRVAFTYYVINRDADARRVADTWRVGAVGEWAAHAAWVSGLASWRLNDCEAASQAFRQVAATTRDSELSAGGFYWNARAEMACRRPQAVEPLLKAAARSSESFYGLVARETLGMTKALPVYAASINASQVESLPNVRRATELARIGEQWLAEDMLRHQAKIGRASDQAGLIAVAKRLDLAGAQYWLATNGQPGVRVEPSARYPAPRWAPTGGWRIDPALAFAHIIQESNFRTDAVSPAGAMGLMQVRPGTAGDTARSRGVYFSASSLTDPATNIEYGQSFIELIRGSGATQGQLPKVIAAYNAGPVPVARWAYIPDKGDPLLWMESIPYWETRYYVPAVLRNMWVYQAKGGGNPPSLATIAAHRWPAFPTSRTNLATIGN
ncbi:MAG TPA: lytic transglycosylase domain-containing protein [Sphingomicrobium sp.]|nr:lytic transglycosylase domain-containing protein [Sphingomicrobium sp.]